jgi:hypothetical protein
MTRDFEKKAAHYTCCSSPLYFFHLLRDVSVCVETLRRYQFPRQNATLVKGSCALCFFCACPRPNLLSFKQAKWTVGSKTT